MSFGWPKSLFKYNEAIQKFYSCPNSVKWENLSWHWQGIVFSFHCIIFLFFISFLYFHSKRCVCVHICTHFSVNLKALGIRNSLLVGCIARLEFAKCVILFSLTFCVCRLLENLWTTYFLLQYQWTTLLSCSKAKL